MSLNCNEVVWSESYCLGDLTIDNEHKQLFVLSEKLFNCNNDEEVFSSLKELIKYTKFHFTHEEKFMESINFKYLDEHKLLHKNIVDNLNQYIEKKQNSDPVRFAKELALFVKDTIIEHILTEDKRVHYFNKEVDLLKDIFAWKDIYKIEHKQIDQEHQQLFSLAVKALNTPKNDKKKHIRDILIELTEYMQEHFKNEEQYMSYIGFSDLEHHQDLHENIISQMNDFIKSLPKLSIAQFERKLIEYMDIWLINHIITEDHKIVCFKKEQEKQV